MSTLENTLDNLTVEGTLYERLPDRAVRCFACGHRCLIRDGRRGICQVRFNQGGTLRVPWGYVAALQSDPIEKKPFFHVVPGSNALTFGMLGCDFHCGYCFTGDTVVITNRGPRTLEECFSSSPNVQIQADAQIGYPSRLFSIAASGTPRRVKAVFRHPYRGSLMVIEPYYLPVLQCTPDHRVYATDDVAQAPKLLRAEELTETHYLAIPRRYSFSSTQTISTAETLEEDQTEYPLRSNLSAEEVPTAVHETAWGKTSMQMGARLDQEPSSIRQIRSQAWPGKINDSYFGRSQIEGNLVRFPHEQEPDFPARIEVNEDVARLLGLYCAEGSVVKSKDWPNRHKLNFSFSPQETEYAVEVKHLLRKVLHIDAHLVKRKNTLDVAVTESSAGLLFKSLAGGTACEKRVPEAIFNAHRSIAEAYLGAVGDGDRFANGKTTVNTVSRDFAYGVAWLALKLGYFPSLFEAEIPPNAKLPGRLVNHAPHQYSVVWDWNNSVHPKLVKTADYYLVPLHGIQRKEFEGQVFNMEIEEEHNYLAGFFLVSNCQNWMTSQALRDPASNASIDYIRKVTPPEMVALARRAKASVVVSSYNEPLITSEWAVGIFKEATAAGLKCAYVSNGNNTPEVMELIRPWISAYKVDLKSMQEKNYRKLGGVLQNTLDGIQRAHDLGLWVEVVTLVIPGFNDSNEELWEAARFITGISADIPWHVTGFHKDYKMTDPDNTDARTLKRAADIGREAGLHYVYAGNLPGRVGEYENTFCPNCNETLVRRSGYVILEYRLTPSGTCPKCGTKVPGVWAADPSSVQLDGLGRPIPVF